MFEANAGTTVDDVKAFVAAREGTTEIIVCMQSCLHHTLQLALQHSHNPHLPLLGIPCDEQTVAFGGKLLEDASVLAEAGVSDEQTLYVLLRLLGGAKKRKKKTYTKPKKQKHKHKKIKLRVLQFYKVEDGGKIQRLRKTCPHCGPGIFMATMFDRVYWYVWVVHYTRCT